MKHKNYNIVTLRDCIGCDEQNLALGQDIFGAGVKFIGGLFGDDRTKLTMSHWNQLFPGAGYWANRLKSYLASKIHYEEDLKFLYDHGDGNMTGDFDNFASDNKCQLFPNYPNCVPPEGIRRGLQKILQLELTGTTSPQVGTTQIGTIPQYQNLIPGQTQFIPKTQLASALPLIAGVVVVGMLLSKQKRGRR